MRVSVLFSGTAFTIGAQAQVGAWGQCGGIGYSGSTICVSGYICTFVNDWYSQCIPVTATTTLATSTSVTTTTAATSAAATGLRWLGVSESVAEFGTAIPGTWGIDFYFPSASTIDTLISEGFNIFRIPFLMERMARGSVSATLDSGYLNNLTAVVTHITGRGRYAILDAHNYGRYSGAVITDTSAFATFWRNLATSFRSNSYVIFDINNEYHDMDQTLVFNLNQAAITAIRGAGATSQYIFVEGNSWTGAWTWNTTNGNLASLSDPQGRLIYEMHQYLDSDGSGSSSTCVSSTVGVDRVIGATNWLRANGKRGVLGEFAGGANSQCLSAVTGLLDHLRVNSDVWQGALWWAAGPWWPADTYASFEPPNGIAYRYYDATLRRYVPAG